MSREAAIPDQGVQSEGNQRSIIRCNQWQSDAIRGNQCEKSEAIDGNQRSKWSSEAISGNQWQSVAAMRGNQWQSVVGQRLGVVKRKQSEAIRGNQMQSDAIRCHQWQSEESSGNQWQSVAAMRGNKWQSVVGQQRLLAWSNEGNQSGVRGNQLQSKAIGGNQRQSEAISGWAAAPWRGQSSEVISGNQRQSKAAQSELIRCNQWQLSGNQWTDSALAGSTINDGNQSQSEPI